MPKQNKTASETPKRKSTKVRDVLRFKNSVRQRPRRNMVEDEVPPSFEPQPSTSSAPDPIFSSDVTPKNPYRFDCAPPGTCEERQYSRNADGTWNFHKDYLKFARNAYKDSPDYRDLKAKRFNTSFRHETRRGDRDIQIFTPEEENDPRYKWPDIGGSGPGLGEEPGKSTEKMFVKWYDLHFKDEDEDDKYLKKLQLLESKKKKRRGRKKKIGQDSDSEYEYSDDGPFTDEMIENLTNWDRFPPGYFDSTDSEEDKDDKKEDPKQSQIKKTAAKKGKRKVQLGQDSDSEYEYPDEGKKRKQKQGKGGSTKKRSRMDKTVNENDNGEHCSLKLNKVDKVSGKEAQDRRKSTRNIERKKYADDDSDDDSNTTTPLAALISALSSDVSPQNGVEEKKKKTPFMVSLLPFEKPVDNRILRVRLYKNINN